MKNKTDLILKIYTIIFIASIVILMVLSTLNINKSITLFLAIFAMLWVLPTLILSIIWNCTRFRPCKFWCHDVLGWCEPSKDSIELDEFGFQYTATCKHCGRKIIQDSQGNWF